MSRRPSNPTPSRTPSTKISPRRSFQPPPQKPPPWVDPRSPKTSPRNDNHKSITSHEHHQFVISPRKKSTTKHNQDRLRAVLGTQPTPTRTILNPERHKKQISIEHIYTAPDPRLNLASHLSPTRTTRPARTTDSANGSLSTPNNTTENLLEKTRMASALNKLGINMGPEVLEHWMNSDAYDGVTFGSMAVLYEVKLKELLSTLPRSIAKGRYPNKVRTALVLGIFKELASSNALGKFKPLLQSVLSTVIDSVYVESVRQYSDGALLNSSDYGKQMTWYEMAQSQVTTINHLNIELNKADILKKRFKADKIMQQHLLTKTIDRWKLSITQLVFKSWSNYYINKKKTMNMINSMMRRKFIEKNKGWCEALCGHCSFLFF